MDITFKYSYPFQSSLSSESGDFPVYELQSMKDFWAIKGQEIVDSLKEITGLSYIEKSLTCYLNFQFSVSDPLCLKIEDIKDMEDNLVHELIHVLLSQNEIGLTQKWKDLMEKYKEESQLTKVHIIIHRIHYLLAQRLFPERINLIQIYSQKPAYKRAWELALQDEVDVKMV